MRRTNNKSVAENKADAKKKNKPRKPRDPRVIAAERGQFFPFPPAAKLFPGASAGGAPQHEPRGPPLPQLGFSVPEFCASVGISVAYYYELKQQGIAPREMHLGSRRLISFEEATKWLAERTEASNNPAAADEYAAR